MPRDTIAFVLWVTMSREYHITNNDIVGDHGPYAIVWAIIATIVYTNPIYPYRSRNCGSTGGFERVNLYTVNYSVRMVLRATHTAHVGGHRARGFCLGRVRPPQGGVQRSLGIAASSTAARA